MTPAAARSTPCTTATYRLATCRSWNCRASAARASGVRAGGQGRCPGGSLAGPVHAPRAAGVVDPRDPVRAMQDGRPPRAAAGARGGMHPHPRRLVDREHGGILEEHLEADVLRLDPR